MASVEVNQMLAAAAAACEDKKAEDIQILALDPSESGLSDYFLICTGTNDRQTVAITDEIEIRLKRDFATYPNSVEGRKQGEWILMDYVDFIVHVFLPEKRAYYGLERLRKTATTLSVADLNGEIKSAIKANRPVKAPAEAKAATKKTAPGAVAAEQAPATKKILATKKAAAAKKGTALKKTSAVKKTTAGKTAAKKSTTAAASKRSAKRTNAEE